jgi:ADP-heptose:LPS heptosyltransferase
LRRCALMIGNDTGPMHLAAALGVPTVAVLGPTAGERIGPWGGGNAVVTAELPCGPCRRRACPPVCGSGGRSGPVHGARCMLEVSPHQVAEAVLRVLAQSPPRTRARPGEGRP